jgi:GrpB-like predicted nucleotidyltransferase (UPF0157 family)
MQHEPTTEQLLGLPRGRVMLRPHREEWHRLFDEERRRLSDALGTFVLAIEHMVELTSDHWWRHLAFRDYLRENPESREAYEALEQSLAGRYRNDREEYTEGKSEFIQGVLRAAYKRAGIWKRVEIPIRESRDLRPEGVLDP